MADQIPVTIPQTPKNFLGLPRFAKQTQRAIKELATRPSQSRGAMATDFVCPFRLTAINGATCYWRVSSTRSHLIDGTNGDEIDLVSGGADWKVGAIEFDEQTSISATSYICLQAEVAGLVTSNWELVAVDATTPDNALEVGIDTDALSPTFGEQIFLRLLIGKIVYDGTSSTVVAHQAVFIPQRITLGLINGAACKVFEAAPIHMNFLGL